MSTVDLGLLGHGAMGGAYHRLIRTHPDLRPLVGRLRVGTRSIPGGWRALDPRDDAGPVDDVLADGSLDAVLIATPPETHEPLAHRALDAGLHVLVEKPAAPTASAARALNRHAAEVGRTLQVVNQLRRVDEWARTRDRIRAGEIGAIRSALVDLPLWRSEEYFAASPERTRSELGNLAYHELDLALWCLGPVDRITVAGSRPVADARTGRLHPFTATLVHASGCLTTLRYSTEAFPGRAPRVSFEGTAGALVLEAGARVVDLAPAAAEVPAAGLYARQTSIPPVDPDWLAPHAAQLRAFLLDPSRAAPDHLDETSIRTIDLIHRIEQHLTERQPT